MLLLNSLEVCYNMYIKVIYEVDYGILLQLQDTDS